MVATLAGMLTLDEPLGEVAGAEPRQLALRLLSTAMARRLLDPSCELDQALSTSGTSGLDRGLAEQDRFCQLRLHCLEALSGRLAAVGRYGAAVDALTVLNELQGAQCTLPSQRPGTTRNVI